MDIRTIHVDNYISGQIDYEEYVVTSGDYETMYHNMFIYLFESIEGNVLWF